MKDVEAGDDTYKPEPESEEQQSLLPSSSRGPPATSRPSVCCPSKGRAFSTSHLIFAFVAGSLACFLTQFALFGTACYSSGASDDNSAHVLAPPYVGSTEVHNWPPATPTNDVPTLFPSDVGHAGATPTGAEPALILTAPSYPVHTGAAQLIVPSTLQDGSKSKNGFDLFKKWGNLSPWYSVKRGAFGIDSDPGAPDGCTVTGLHLLHRHGARYPTAWCKWTILRFSIWFDVFFNLIDGGIAAYGGPAELAHRLNEAAANWTAQGDLDFLNNW